MADAAEPEEAQVSNTQIVDGGRWEDGKFISPDGWPEGAGWVVRNADGSIAQWGPASDLALVVSTVIGDAELPPAAELDAAFVGILQPQEEEQGG